MTLRGPHAADDWASEIAHVERAVAEREGRAGDCREIDVVVDAAGATVTFTTRDGRMAVRHIAQPSELAPLVDALVITGPVQDEPPAPHVAPPPLSPTLPVQTPYAREAPVSDAPRTLADRGRVLLSVGAGLRHAPGFEGSGVAGVEIAALLGRWELGLMGRWEADQEPDDDRPSGHVHLSAIGGGLVLGHRAPVGPFVLVVGATAGAFAARESLVKRTLATDGRHESRTSDSFVDPRLGAYAGLVFPLLGRFRLRSQIDAAFGVGSHVASSAELPALPKWSFTLAIGVETSVLP